MALYWLTVLAIAALVLALLSMLLIALDILGGHRQRMAIMNVVWPITALYFGPLTVWIYWSIGRAPLQGTAPAKQRKRPFWETTFVGVTHCGAGCTLGDIIAEWTVFWLGITLAGIALWPEYIADYTLALLLGIIFQYFAIAPMQHISGWRGIWAATKADFLSLTAFEVGLFLLMALSSLDFFKPALHPNNPVYWFMMQIGMMIGFATSYPMNWWLIKRGIKEAM